MGQVGAHDTSLETVVLLYEGELLVRERPYGILGRVGALKSGSPPRRLRHATHDIRDVQHRPYRSFTAIAERAGFVR